MRRLIYVSMAAVGADSARLEAITAESVVWNTSVGVTGMLWFDGTNFAQVLESDDEAIVATMGRISRDPRHCSIEIVLNRQIKHRMFARWAMMRADDRESATMSTSFFIGYARSLETDAGRRLYEIVLASG
jgi:hypothetical protein